MKNAKHLWRDRIISSVAASTVVGFTSASNAGMLIDVRAVGVSGTGVQLLDRKNVLVTPASVGGSVTYEIWAVVTAKNDTHADDGFQKTTYSMVSRNVNGGAIKGNMVNTGGDLGLQLPYVDGAQVGSLTDIDGDGDRDIGRGPVPDYSDYIYNRISAMKPIVGNSLSEFLVYKFSQSISLVNTASTNAYTNESYERQNNLAAHIWYEDGKPKHYGISTMAYSNSRIYATTANRLKPSVSITASALNPVVTGTAVAAPASLAVDAATAPAVLPSILSIADQTSIGSVVNSNALTGQVEVMLWLKDQDTTNTVTPNTLLSALASSSDGSYSVIPSTSSTYQSLQSSYPGFNGLLQFNGGISATSAFNWNFDLFPEFTVDQYSIAPAPAVPEPTAIAAFGLGSICLLRRRRVSPAAR